MNIILGLVLIVVAIGFFIFLLPMAGDMWTDEPLMLIGGSVIIIPLLILLVGVGLVMIFSPTSLEESLMEGACYRAYGETNIVPVGKVFIPIHDVKLVEIRCP